jgi:hypothetical protein
MFSFLCILTSIIVGLCLFFVFFGHTMFYHALVSFKKREMLTIREHLCSPSAFLMGFMWLIFLVFWAVVFLLVFVLYRVSNVAGGTGLSMLPVSLNCQCCLCHWIVNVMLPVSLDCQCCLCPWIVNVACVTGLSTFRLHLRFSLTFIGIVCLSHIFWFESRSWRGVLDTTLCNKVCQWLATDRPVTFSRHSGLLHQ